MKQNWWVYLFWWEWTTTTVHLFPSSSTPPPPPPPPLTATTTTFRCMVDDSDVVMIDSTISSRYRSCQFHNLFVTTRNTDMNKNIVFPSPEEVALQELLQTLPNQELVTISSIRSPMILSWHKWHRHHPPAVPNDYHWVPFAVTMSSYNRHRHSASILDTSQPSQNSENHSIRTGRIGAYTS